MKVMSLNDGVKFASNEILPATCTAKPNVTYMAKSPNMKTKGYSNEEIYDALVAIRNFVLAPFKNETKPNLSVNYLA
jgi:hypothetical protein